MLHLSTSYKACNLVTPYYRIRCLTSICKNVQRHLQESHKRSHGNQPLPIKKDGNDNMEHVSRTKTEENEEYVPAGQMILNHGGKTKQQLWPEGSTIRRRGTPSVNKQTSKRGLHAVSKRRWGNHLTACIQHRCEGIPDGEKVKCALNHCEMFQV